MLTLLTDTRQDDCETNVIVCNCK